METYHSSENGTVTGTTTSAYVVAKSVSAFGGARFKITNATGATATMYYKIDGYISTSSLCVADAITAETDVVSTTPVINEDVLKNYARVDISVKSHSGACAYQIDWITY